MGDERLHLWLRGLALVVVILGGLFMVYGRLVSVETRLISLEKQVEDLTHRLFPKVAVHRITTKGEGP